MKSFFDFSERYGSRRGGFRDLMGHQVRHVLLVSSLYESFILAEDGHLHERVLDKFFEAGVGLRYRGFDGWTLKPEVRYSRNDSNLTTSDYSRFVGALTARYQFK